jgi:hypothetical protein
LLLVSFIDPERTSCPSKMSDASFLADSRIVNQPLTGTADL